MLRAYSRYLRQLGTLYSQSYIEDTLAAHPDIARGLVECFVTRLDPWLNGQEDTDRLVDQIEAAIERVETLDEDRILRSLLHLVLATLRTNWFQPGPDGELRASVVIKLDPSRIPDCAAAAPAVRDLLLLAARRRCAPARRAASRAAASAGRTGGKTSAPRSSG